MTNDARRKCILMTCVGICIRPKAPRPAIDIRYSTGQKRCQVCEIFLRWDAHRNTNIFCGIHDDEMSDFLNKAKEKVKEAAKETTDTITGQKDDASNLTDQAKEKAKEAKDPVTGDQ
jgi:hypothetical protein